MDDINSSNREWMEKKKSWAFYTKEAYGIVNDFLSFSYSKPKVKVDDVADEKN